MKELVKNQKFYGQLFDFILFYLGELTLPYHFGNKMLNN